MLDLHMHSTASDGTDTPEEILIKCAKLNLELSSVTDHDSIDSQEEAIKTAAERKIRYLTGVEFSVQHTGELHILGYGVDIRNAAFAAMMEELKASRVERVHLILKRLKEQKIPIEFHEVERHAKGNTLGRPHVALALMEKGYAGSLKEAFDRYLNESGLCYVRRRKLNAKEAIGLVHSAGGTPVLAHPKFVRTGDMDALISGLQKDGMMGIEAYYPAHTDREVEKYLALAKRYGLIVTAGSDYHGRMRDGAAIACEKRTGPQLVESVEYLRNTYIGG